MSPRRRAALAMLACAGTGLVQHARAASETTPWKTGKTPPLALSALDGTSWSLSHHKGRVVLVSFWATWCEPCHAEMPSMQALADRLGPDKLVVVGKFDWASDAAEKLVRDLLPR